MKKTNLLLITLLIGLIYVGCDLVDGTGVENPNLTLDEAASQPNSAQALVTGLNRRSAFLYNSFLTTAELTTDNYQNRATFFNQNVDSGQFRDSDSDINGAQFQINRLRETALFGLNTVLQNDTGAQGTELEAEMHFFLGYSHLMAAENFVALPAEPAGVPQSPDTHFQAAIAAFSAANQVSQHISYDLALARAHYGLGNRGEAVSFAQSVVSADPDFVRYIGFDGINGPTSTFENAVYNRQTFNDLQPLPRLDFLDPKYGDEGGTSISSIPFMKTEEAHLIIAEAQLASGSNDLAGAKQTMLNLYALVQTRPVDEIDERAEGRVGTSVEIQRPNRSDYLVASEAGAPLRAGLVLDRTQNTPTPRISGTSVTEQMINDAADISEALYVLYLMRQEIFFGEGRRMADLGVRWPVSENEALNNPNVTAENRMPFVPSFIPTPFGDMNRFQDTGIDAEGNRIEAASFEVTMLVDMNRILVQSRGNKFD
jgi:hypothetical protein